MQQALCLKLLVVTAFATAALGAEGGSDTPDVIKIFLRACCCHCSRRLPDCSPDISSSL